MFQIPFHQLKTISKKPETFLDSIFLTHWNYVLIVIWLAVFCAKHLYSHYKRPGSLICNTALKWETIKIPFSLFLLHIWWDYFTWMVSSFLFLSEEKKKRPPPNLLNVFKHFFTLESSMYLTTIKQLSSQLPCDASNNPCPSSAIYIETISSSGCAL